jgi:hypothetical protein
MPSYISEDNTMMYNKWVQGIATRDLNGEPILMSDLKTVSNTQNYTVSDIGYPDIKVPRTLPYPLNTVYDDIAGFVIAYGNIMEKLQRSLQNPVTKGEEKKQIELVIKNFSQIEKVIKGTISAVDKETK